ncbi:inovirus-type Gp2 protein, partial [Acinetobacter sp. V102_4]|uniref:inovirus-type Gp2 protein n=1 Tax=Acinetobacter sp. V102_4 TaxID=3072984 RepID=UPI00287CAE96
NEREVDLFQLKSFDNVPYRLRVPDERQYTTMTAISRLSISCAENAIPAIVLQTAEGEIITYQYAPWFELHQRFFDQCMLFETGHFKVGSEILSYVDARSAYPDTPLLQMLPPAGVPLEPCHIKIIHRINRFVNHIRENMLGPETKRELRKRKKHCRKNYRSCVKWFGKHLNTYSKVMVVRLDLYYKFGISELINTSPDFEGSRHNAHCLMTIKTDVERLLGNFRSDPTLKEIIGYCLKFEHGPYKGQHVHCIILLDGHAHQKDVKWAEDIGQYWVKLTNGKGAYHNCNRNSSDYKYPCTGMISYDDHEKIHNLCRCLAYLCKSDQYFLFAPLACFRTIQKSVAPKEKSGMGRP